MEYEVYRIIKDTDRIKTHVLVVNPSNANMEDLKVLGERLKERYHSTDIVNVFIFDDQKAADLLRDTDPDYMPSFYDNHFIASYNRNVNSKYHRFFIHLPKEEGGEFEIFYPI